MEKKIELFNEIEEIDLIDPYKKLKGGRIAHNLELLK